MKKIQLKGMNKCNGTYHIRIGNGTLHEFPSMRAGIAFLNKTSRFLTQCLYEASECYRQVWNAYQDIWFLFSPNTGENMLRLEGECKDSFQVIEKMRELIIMKADNYTVFNDFSILFSETKRVLKTLIRIHKRRSHTPAIYKLHALYREVMRLETTVSQYCEEDADFLIDIKKNIPYKHFSQNGMERHAKYERQ